MKHASRFELTSGGGSLGRMLFPALAFLMSALLGQEPGIPVSVSALEVGAPLDTLLVAGVGITPEDLARHNVKIADKPATSTRISLWKWQRCEWTMSTPEPGKYLVALFMTSGKKRPGRFGYMAGAAEHLSEPFTEKGSFSGCLRVFAIQVPAGQTSTRMFLEGDGLYFYEADLTRAADVPGVVDGRIVALTPSSYRTVLRRAGHAAAAVLSPETGPEHDAAARIAAHLHLPHLREPILKAPFPAYPLADMSADTNLILVSAGRGGPLVQALRRAGWVLANEAISSVVLSVINTSL